MEVGWYLRLGKSDRIEAQVSIQGAEQVQHQAYIFRDWDFNFHDRGDHVLAIMTRKKPLFADKEES